MQKFSFVFLIVGIVLMISVGRSLADESSNRSKSIVLPPDPIFFQAGKGRDIANTYCLICHSAEYIYMQPKHSKKKWDDIIQKMQRIFGCPIPQNQIPALVEYLFQQNSVSPPSPTGSP